MSNSPQQAKSNLDKTDPKVQFKTENIGSWASRQENPFAKQNRERQTKKQERDKKRQKVAPFFVTFASAAVIGVALWGLVMLVVGLVRDNTLPADITLGSTGALELQDKAQALFNQHVKKPTSTGDSSSEGNSDGNDATTPQPSEEEVDAAIGAVNDFYNQWSETTNDELKKAELMLLEMETFYNNAQMGALVEASKKANYEVLNTAQKSQYYGMLVNASNALGDVPTANMYLELMKELHGDNNEIEEVEG